MSDTSGYVYVLTYGTHDDKRMLGVYRTVAAAKRAADDHHQGAVPWECEDATGARSVWDRRNEPYHVEQWAVEGSADLTGALAELDAARAERDHYLGVLAFYAAASHDAAVYDMDGGVRAWDTLQAAGQGDAIQAAAEAIEKDRWG